MGESSYVKLDLHSKILNENNFEYFKANVIDSYKDREDLVNKKRELHDQLNNNLDNARNVAIDEVFQKVSKWAEENNLVATRSSFYFIEVKTKDEIPLLISKPLSTQTSIVSNKGDFLFKQTLNEFVPLAEKDNVLINEAKALMKKLIDTEEIEVDKDIHFEISEEFLSNAEEYFGVLLLKENTKYEVARINGKLHVVKTQGLNDITLI